MNMLAWAENEINIATKNEDLYGCACYTSALKAFKSLCEDGHSGFSFSLTKNILIRLMNHHPLMPITDDDFKNAEVVESAASLQEHNLKSSVQCPRMSSLFRDETIDGIVTYCDVGRYYCFDIDDPNNTYSCGDAASILDEMFPITMPYYPSSDKYQIACETFLVDKEMGDFDTRAYHYIITPDGNKVEVNKFYKEVKDGDVEERSYETASYIDENGNEVKGKINTYLYRPVKWIEITKSEFEERRMHKIEDIN